MSVKVYGYEHWLDFGCRGQCSLLRIYSCIFQAALYRRMMLRSSQGRSLLVCLFSAAQMVTLTLWSSIRGIWGFCCFLLPTRPVGIRADERRIRWMCASVANCWLVGILGWKWQLGGCFAARVLCLREPITPVPVNNALSKVAVVVTECCGLRVVGGLGASRLSCPWAQGDGGELVRIGHHISSSPRLSSDCFGGIWVC